MADNTKVRRLHLLFLLFSLMLPGFCSADTITTSHTGTFTADNDEQLFNLAIGQTGATVLIGLGDMQVESDSGTLLQTASINLAARGHTSFLLPTAYPSAVNVRGMAEFVIPVGGRSA